MIFFVAVILIKIFKITKNSPIISRDIVRNGVKIENKKKSPSEIEESAENDGENFEICKKFPMADKYVGNDLGKCLNYPKIPQYWKL